MWSNHRHARAVARLTVCAAAIAAAAPALAQEEAPQDDEIIVTGTRIARDPNLTAPLPIQSLGRDDLRLSGERDLTETLNDIPALLTTTTAENSLNGVFSGGGAGVGTATLNLRALGRERTLVVVNGQRHVSGIAGEAVVDINTIPSALVDRIDVLTGGASQIYGADAVTGVVNFILKRDFEGLEFDVNGGISGEGDGERYGFSGVAGKNFFDDRLNVTVAVDYSKREQILFGDRDFSRNNGIADDLPNPDGGPGQPTRVILPDPRFSISSNTGVILAGDFSAPQIDVDNNGVFDCEESTVGQNAVFGIGGCWVSNGDGTVRPYQDGIVTGAFIQFGGDGIPNNFDQDFLTPDVENVVGNILLSYDLADNIQWTFDGKIADTTALFGGPLNTFYDLLTAAPDNPFTPDQLAGVSADAGGLFVTRDPTDLGPNIDEEKRRTLRFVTGIEAEGSNGFKYDFKVNYGRFTREQINNNRVIQDRFFAAVDATTNAAGEPICRSDIDPTAPPTTPFNIPAFDPGFFTFNPGDGQCVPYNVFGGFADQTQEAIDFITTTTVNEFTLEQTVLSGSVVGDLDQLFTLPGGSIGFSTGFEYRAESSDSVFDPLVRGVAPLTTPDINEGELVSDLPNVQNSLVFDPGALTQNEGGTFSVWEYFFEARLPLIQDRPFFDELSVEGGARFADYTTVGATLSWGVAGAWSPVEDVKFRVSYAKPIRAPNIEELFAPAQGATFRPIDPCDQQEVDALLASGDPRGPVREANCRADGIPEGYNDPLSARFVGETAGNPELVEETASTFSVGAIVQPRFVPGLTVTVDYWSIQIDQAISSPSAQDIVDSCYDSAGFAAGADNQFCELFTRNRDAASPQFLGFNFLRQQELNFASLDARGLDAQASYDFSVGRNDFNVTLNGTWTERIDEFFNPADPTALDPELGELQRPEFAANGFLTYTRGPFRAQWQTQFQDEQGLRAVEIETVDQIFGPAGIADAVFIHDFNASYDYNDQIQVYGGVNNVTDREPFITEQAFPVSPLGRYFFLGARFTM